MYNVTANEPEREEEGRHLQKPYDYGGCSSIGACFPGTSANDGSGDLGQE